MCPQWRSEHLGMDDDQEAIVLASTARAVRRRQELGATHPAHATHSPLGSLHLQADCSGPASWVEAPPSSSGRAFARDAPTAPLLGRPTTFLPRRSSPRNAESPSTSHPMHSRTGDVSVMRNAAQIRYRPCMAQEQLRRCPQCGAPVSYGGRGRRPVWCSSRCRNTAAVTRRGAREAAVQIRMIDVAKAPKPRPVHAQTREERDESALSRVAGSARLTRQLLDRLERRRLAGELDSDVWADVRARLAQSVRNLPVSSTLPVRREPGPAPAPPASSATVPELIRAVDRLSTGLETGRIYDRDFVALGPALERLGAAWVRRTSR